MSVAQTTNYSNEWVSWIEEAISKQHIKYYECKQFYNIQKIGKGALGEIYRANWKNWEQYVIIKSLNNLNSTAIKEVIYELERHREAGVHNNIIRFYGVTSEEYPNSQLKKYLLVMEYVDVNTLRNYLQVNFKNLTWEDKYKFAYQLASTVSYLHDEEIFHCDLHSNSILVHQKTIKLIDFGLSKRIGESSYIQPKIWNVIPYVDPKIIDMKKGNLIDVYSIGVLFWEISSGRRPFENRNYDTHLAMDIRQGLRETPVPDTTNDYIELYTECWNNEPDNRPDMNQVVDRLKSIITKYYQKDNDNLNSLSFDDIVVQNFDKRRLTTSSIKENISFEKDLSIMIDKLINFHYDDLNKEKEPIIRNQHIYDYFNNHNITSFEAYNWLLNNQNDLDSIYLLAYFSDHGIGTNADQQKAFELYQKSATLGNSVAKYNLANGIVKKDYNKAFKLFKELADEQHPDGMNMLGYCYYHGIGTDINKEKAFKLYQKASNLGSNAAHHNLTFMYRLGEGIGTIRDYENGIEINVEKQKLFEIYQKAANLGNHVAQHNLANMYMLGEGIEKNYDRTFELCKKSAAGGYSGGIIGLGYCYENGIGTKIDYQKAFELYQEAAYLGNHIAQYNLAVMYRLGKGVYIDYGRAFELLKKSAEGGYSYGINLLGDCYDYGIGININKQKAFELYQMAANLGNHIAQHNLAEMYRLGEFVDKDYNKTFELCKKSAAGGYSGGIIGLGYCYENGIGTNIDKQKAFELFQKAANLGSSAAQYNLAIMYRLGEGVEKNYGKTFELLEKSAEGGYLHGINLLGDCYDFGIGTDVDKQKAFKLYQKAASLGSIAAQQNLTDMFWSGEETFELFNKESEDEFSRETIGYENGIETNTNEQKPSELHQQASLEKNETHSNLIDMNELECDLNKDYNETVECSEGSAEYADKFTHFGTDVDKKKALELYQEAVMYRLGEGVDKDYDKAFELSKKSAEGGHPDGINLLGDCYDYGIGTSVDTKKAFELYQQAANLGNSAAQHNLADIYRLGKGVYKNYNKAFKLCTKSATGGYPGGIIGLGYCYENGIGTNIDKQKAFELYHKAALLGNSSAQYNLAYLYRNGEGVTKDKNQAMYWYKKSAEQGFKKAIDEYKRLEDEL